jgi:hypothetical protein
MSEADRIIRRLKLKPHPEGGHFHETFRDVVNRDGRAHCTAIYFLLKQGEVSRWHRIDAVEIWTWHAGSPLELSIAETGKRVRRIQLGGKIDRGHAPQAVVPAGAWQAARCLGEYTLVSCIVAPGFEFSAFELGPDGFDPARISARPSRSSARSSARARSRAKTRGRNTRDRD